MSKHRKPFWYEPEYAPLRLALWIVALLIGLLLTGCGGGGSSAPSAPAPPPGLVTLGDSIQSGTFARPDGSVARHNPTPSQRMQEVLGDRFTVEDRSVPGMTVRNALEGGFSWLYIPASPPFERLVRSSSASTILFRYGTADALLLTKPEDFRRDLRELLRLTLSAGKRPVLVEPIHQMPEVALADPLRDIVLELAQELGVQFIPVRDLPCVLIDRIHPDQPCEYRLAERIASQL